MSHIVEHVVQDTKQLGEIEYMVADDFEKSHEQFQDHNSITSRRKLTAVSDTAKLQEEYLSGEAIATREGDGRLGIIHRTKVNTLVMENHLRFNAVMMEFAFLLEKGHG